MPRAGEPRVTVRFSAAEYAGLEAQAASAGVAVGALVREAAVRHGAAVAREAAEGRITLRRQAKEKASGPVLARRVLEVRSADGSGERPRGVRPPDADPAPSRSSVDPATARAIAFRRATGAL